MLITNFSLIVVELLSKPTHANHNDKNKSSWDFEPDFEIGENDNGDIVQNITINLKRIKGGKCVTLKTRTSFTLTLATKDVMPSTNQDFELYALMTQMALAHTRIIFQYEMKGTQFAKDLLPQDTNENIIRRIKLGMGLNNQQN